MPRMRAASRLLPFAWRSASRIVSTARSSSRCPFVRAASPAGSAAGAAAIPILEGLRDATVQIGPFALGQFHCLYAICFILMIPATCGAAFFPAREKALE